MENKHWSNQMGSWSKQNEIPYQLSWLKVSKSQIQCWYLSSKNLSNSMQEMRPVWTILCRWKRANFSVYWLIQVCAGQWNVEYRKFIPMIFLKMEQARSSKPPWTLMMMMPSSYPSKNIKHFCTFARKLHVLNFLFSIVSVLFREDGAL